MADQLISVVTVVCSIKCQLSAVLNLPNAVDSMAVVVAKKNHRMPQTVQQTTQTVGRSIERGASIYADYSDYNKRTKQASVDER
jgi:hypothetical protein